MNQKSQNGYLLLFRDNAWYNDLSHENIQKVVAQSKAWIEQLAARGLIKGGQALARKGAVISGKTGHVIKDGPFAEAKEAIGGYLVLDLNTLEEAIEIAQTSPAVAYGTTIEVRPIADECPLEACARQWENEQKGQLAAATV